MYTDVYVLNTSSELEKAPRECNHPPSRHWNSDHVTIRFAIWHFILVILLNRTSISNGFRYICIQVFAGYYLDLLGSRDVIRHVTM